MAQQALAVSSAAPDFALMSGDRERWSLRGVLRQHAAVLVFYLWDFSGTWTQELTQFGAMAAEFEAVNAQVFGISVDSIYSHAAFARQRDLPFPLLSDFNKEVSRDYGVLIDYGPWKDVSARAVFVVGRDGTIRYAWHAEPGDLPDLEQVLTVARAAGR